jgi:hypothetical protein
MAQHLTVHWHSYWTLLCHLQEATHKNRLSMLFEGTKMLGALIMWFAGRDQHMQVHHRECCSMS